MKLYLRTFGCRANHADTEMVRAMAVAGGYEIVQDAAHADVAVLNSCAVTAEAERDARKAVRRVAAMNPRARTIVMGCASALPSGAAALRDLPGIHALVAGNDREAIADALGVPATKHVMPQETVRAVLRVQDGCDEHCTFCATTIARGANRSRAIADLVREATVLAAHHPEIVITGTHIGTYGLEIDSSLGALMERLLIDVPEARFRLSSIEATEVDDRLVELFSDAGGQLVPHLHAPLQSGSDRLLRRMGRHWYTAQSYATAIERLAAKLSVFGLGADVIAGFPGERADDHQATVALIERLPFTYLHVFTYSPRPGTAATRLPDQVSPAEAEARSRELRQLGASKAQQYRAHRAGSSGDLVVIGGGARRDALTEDYLTVRLGEAHPRGARFRAELRLDGDSLVAA